MTPLTTDPQAFVRCTAQHPCPICGKDSWCQRIGDHTVQCMRQATGSYKTITQADGADAYLHRLTSATAPPLLDRLPPERATPAILDRVYRTLLDLLPPLPETSSQRAGLRERGLSAAAIDQRGYRELSPSFKPWTLATAVAERCGADVLGTPGFIIATGKTNRYLTINTKAGLLIPVRDRTGRIVAMRVRPENGTVKYFYLSSAKVDWHGPKAWEIVHVPLGTCLDGPEARVTEGPLKADVCAELDGLPTLGLPSISGTKYFAAFLADVPTLRVVRIALDAEYHTNPAVVRAAQLLWQIISDAGRTPRLEVWDGDQAKGIDDAFAAKLPIQVLDGTAATTFLSNTSTGTAASMGTNPPTATATTTANPNPTENNTVDTTPEQGPRRLIVVDCDEIRVNNQTISALAHDPILYTRGGQIVKVVHEPPMKHPQQICFPSGPRLLPVSAATLRERQTVVARYLKHKRNDAGEVISLVDCPPPAWSTAAVLDRGVWPELRPLHAVVDYPVFLPDGSVLTTPGYHAASGLYYVPRQPEVLPLLATPTLADAQRAMQQLLEVVSDFPFATPHHRSAWFAALLTPLARFAFAGATPLFVSEANVPGCGKGLLLDSIALIVRGQEFAVTTYPTDDEELRKRITAVVLRGAPMALFDNVMGEMGSAVLDALLTSARWSDRVLGESRDIEMPMLTVWYATGNNIALVGDTVRRVCPIRLESLLERPEERADLRHPDLRGWLRTERERLLAAALTILQAYHHAGRPDQDLPSWGSYEGWSALIRNALVWVGLDDPWQGRLELRNQRDVEFVAMAALLQAWPLLDPDERGLTAAQIVARLTSPELAHHPELVEVATVLAPGRPDNRPRTLGYRLRRFHRRVINGWYLDQIGMTTGQRRWARVNVNSPTARPQGSPLSPPTPTANPSTEGGDSRFSGDIDCPRAQETQSLFIVPPAPEWLAESPLNLLSPSTSPPWEAELQALEQYVLTRTTDAGIIHAARHFLQTCREEFRTGQTESASALLATLKHRIPAFLVERGVT